METDATLGVKDPVLENKVYIGGLDPRISECAAHSSESLNPRFLSFGQRCSQCQCAVYIIGRAFQRRAQRRYALLKMFQPFGEIVREWRPACRI
jgi:hypothetical protein